MRNCTRVALVVMSCLPLAFAQNSEREMTCDDHWQNDRVSHCEINEMTIPATPRLSVDGGVNGGMTVKGWQKNEILVRAKVQTDADSDAQAKALAKQIIIHTGGGRIMADGPSMGHHENWSVSYEVFVPKSIDLDLRAHNGGIHIADVRGRIEFETTNGGVSLTVPSSYSAHLETGTVNGHVDVEFPVTVRGEISRQLSFDLGSGGPLVRAVTTNGGVSIKRKET